MNGDQLRAMAAQINNPDIHIDWLMLWYEVENFYGDLQKKETREELLKRLQTEYNLEANK